MIPAIDSFWPSLVVSLVVTALLLAAIRLQRRLRRQPSQQRIDEVFRSIAENSPQGLVVVQDLRVIFANKAFSEICGYTVEELLQLESQQVKKMIHPEDSEFVWRGFRERLEGKQVPTFTEYRGIRKDGSTIWVEMISTVVTYRGKPAVQGAVTDITERKRVEGILRQNEAKQRAILCALPDLIFEIRRDGVFVGFHGTREDLYVPEEEFIDKPVPAVLPPEIADATMDRLDKTLTSGEMQIYKYQLDIKDETRRFECRMVPRDHDTVLVIVRDITEEVRTQEQLRDSSLLLRSAIDNLPFEFFAVGNDGRYIMQNIVCRELWGDCVGKTPQQVAPNDQMKSVWQENNRRAFSGETVKGEVSHETPGRGKKYLYNVVAPIRGEGTINGIIGVNIDITERKLMDVALRNSESRYRQLVDNAPVGIISVDTEGNVIDANPTLLDLLGSPSLAATKSINIIRYQPLVDAGVAGDFDLCLQRGEGITTERPYKSTWGKQVYLRYHLTPLRNADNEIVGVQGIFEDVAAQKRFEEELARAEKLESIGLLAGGIAHDFNNILTAVLGNVSLAKLALESNGEAVEVLGEAEAALARAQDLTRQLLTFSKGGAPVLEVASVEDLVQDSVGLALLGSNVKCQYDLDTTLHPVKVDAGQVRQVFYNLVINANQAMPRGGRLRISARNRLLTEESSLAIDPGEYVEIAVADEGVGIPRENLQRIFDPYFTTKATGNGLGLATVYSIVKHHRGCVVAESHPGEGTTFRVYLPACFEREIPDSTQSKAKETGSAKILVMDDEKCIRQVAGRILEKLGYTAQTAADGEEAIAVYREALSAGNPFDLVILDLTIPGGLGGRETLGRLKSINPHVRALVSSGYSNDPVIANYREFGFCAYVSKPYRSEDLASAVADALSTKPGLTDIPAAF